MGKKIVLDVSITDTTAPRLPTVDPAETPGSLMLLDLNHPAEPLAAGVPANGAAIPNLLADTAAGIVGAPSSTLDATFVLTNGSELQIERSGKGGLHTIVSKATDTSAFGHRFSPATPIQNFIAAHLADHDFAIFQWSRITRGGVQAATVARIASVTSATANRLMSLRLQNADVAAGGAQHYAPSPQSAYVGTSFMGARSAGFMGTIPAQASYRDGFGVAGTANGINSSASGVAGNKPSVLFYRTHIIDLTVMAAALGITVAEAWLQADAQEFALYQAEVLTAGGRYYNDTFTDPAVKP